MATALYYGIKTDTQDLGRNATDANYKAAITPYPNMDLKTLSRVEHPELPRNYFANLDRSVHEAKIYGDVILCDLGLLTSPDLVALTSDFLIRIAGVRWSFVKEADDSRFIFSLRTRCPNQNAALVARRLINGASDIPCFRY
jgi:nanoRNase/pAp phosphatase (c-di-AMP/oligoRNAs hydrolase)